MILLENEYITATINPLGAELKSLKAKTNNKEYMWQADAAYWAKHSPILFPIVGGLKDNSYTYNGSTYHLSRHGFAREKMFAVEKVSDTKAIFTLTHTKETLVVFPFQFVLQVVYEIKEASLSCTYQVTNNGKDEMYFSIGAHPAFDVDGNYNDWYLQFNNDESIERYKLDNNLISNNTQVLPLENKKLQLDKSLFYEDAIVLKTLQSNEIVLSSDTTKMKFGFNNFPFFGIWAAKDAPFVCLEPWCGIADGVEHNGDLKSKEGINKLASNEHFERTWAVTILA